MTDHWTPEQYEHYRKTGQTPEQQVKIEKAVYRAEVKAEKELQTQCEQWLHHRGYLRLTAENAGKPEPKGWYGHLVQAKRNPLMPDLFIFNADMSRSLMIELKVKAVFQPGQREMIERNAWWVAYNFETVVGLVETWEKL